MGKERKPLVTPPTFSLFLPNALARLSFLPHVA